MKMLFNVTIHGYGGYTSGCRCEVCREAKRAYMRSRRTRAVKLASASTRITCPEDWPAGIYRYMARGVKHGTRFAYDERGCRCFDCTDHARTWKASPNGATRKEPAAA